jgi:hypothetical protein
VCNFPLLTGINLVIKCDPYVNKNKLLEFRYVVAPEVHPLTTIYLYHEYHYSPPEPAKPPDEDNPYGVPPQPARQYGHYTSLLPAAEHFRGLPGVGLDHVSRRYVFLPFPFLTALRDLYNYSIVCNQPLPYHLLKQDWDTKIYSTEPGYNRDCCLRPTCFFNRPGDRPRPQLSHVPSYALDEYQPDDFFPPSSFSSSSSSSSSSAADPGDGDYVGT